MKNKTLKTFFLWILVIVMIVAIVIWAYLVFKTYSYKTELASIRSEIASTSDRETYLISVKNLLRDMNDKLEFIENRFIDEDGIPVFIDFLENKASLYGVRAEIGGINLDPLSKNASFRILRVRVTGTGPWENIISFVNSLDTMEYAARMEKISFSKEAKGSDWTVSIDISQNIK